MGLSLLFLTSCSKESDNNNTPPPNSGTTVTDIDGNVYHSVTIGTQVWMVENLKTTKYRDGTSIPKVIDNLQWMNLTTGAYSWYNNDPANKDTYGALYNWFAVNTKILAPTGWHIPTNAEWATLQNYVAANLGTSGSVAKALAATTNWASSTDAGAVGNGLTKNNASGFTALPGGCRIDGSYNGSFNYIGLSGYWWSSSELNANTALHRGLQYSGSDVYSNNDYKNCGASVRCLRD